ncbi:MAG: hypothetical protein GF313_01615 [Caldithrix sp.]|nr:hypothetical protein [Caldithrix sp.]
MFASYAFIPSKTVKWFLLSTAFMLVSAAVAGNDDLYVPINIEDTYKKGTRSKDGTPGPHYWQNHSKYTIHAELQPHTGLVRGSQSIVYHNESPDTLHQIVFRMYQDIFKKGSMRDWPVHTEDLHDGMQIERILIENDPLSLSDESSNIRRRGTNLFLNLTDPLLPDSELNLQIDWHFNIARKSKIRMGRYDTTAYFVAYWFPQIAVYDDIDGWDTFNFGGLQEFYNDFSDFKVHITVPRDFLVWATGTLQNPQDVLTQPFLKRYQRARQSDTVYTIVTADDLAHNQITKRPKGGKNTWTFKAQRIPDFAFAISDHHLWDGKQVALDDGQDVFVASAYKKESKDFYEVTEIAGKTVRYFSEELPGIPFPFPEITIFNGRGGMEFPMMVNDGSTSTRPATVGLTSHEIAHTYFPFYMGTNERKYAWMDEGWAVMLPFELQARLADYDPIKKIVDRYAKTAGEELDLPMIATTIVFGSNAYRPGYRTSAYTRPGLAYLYLQDVLGNETFKKTLQAFMQRWKGKHPMPFDFFYTFNEVSGQNLNWFWKPWFFEFGYPDLTIDDVQQNDDRLTFRVRKNGRLPVPLNVKFVYADGSSDSLHFSTNIWKTTDTFEKTIQTDKPLQKLDINHPHVPDVHKSNNIYEP